MKRLALFLMCLGIGCASSGSSMQDRSGAHHDAGAADSGTPPTPGVDTTGSACTPADAFSGAADSDFSLIVENDPEPTWQGGPVTEKCAGTMTVGSVNDALSLTGSDGTVATFSGMLPPLAAGARVWASLDQLTSRPNPFASYQTRDNLVRLSKNGPVLAEDLIREIPDHVPGDVSFLGVSATVAPDCTAKAKDACWTARNFDVTIHGDTDLRLRGGARGRVKIGGIAYDVEVDWAGTIEYFDGTAQPGGSTSFHHEFLTGQART
jgi:hypothetical protein